MITLEKLKRDDIYISSLVDKDFTIKKDLSIIFPSRFLKVGLATIGREVKVIGIFIITDGEKYKLVIFPSQLTIYPMSIMEVNFKDTSYQVLNFKSGMKLFEELKFIPNKDDIETLFDDFIIRNNNIPFYINYEDLLNIFIKGSKLTGNPKGHRFVEFSSILAIIARDSDNNYMRIHPKKVIEKSKITYVGLSNVAKAFKNTFSNIAGPYLDKGITASLNNDKPVHTDIGDILRK